MHRAAMLCPTEPVHIRVRVVVEVRRCCESAGCHGLLRHRCGCAHHHITIVTVLDHNVLLGDLHMPIILIVREVGGCAMEHLLLPLHTTVDDVRGCGMQYTVCGVRSTDHTDIRAQMMPLLVCHHHAHIDDIVVRVRDGCGDGRSVGEGVERERCGLCPHAARAPLLLVSLPAPAPLCLPLLHDGERCSREEGH